MRKAVLVDGLRTPFLKAGTVPGITASDLGVVPAKELVNRYHLAKHADYVVGANVGNQLLHPDGSNLGRILALKSGFPLSIGAWTVNINCATGLHAIADAASKIELGAAKCILVIAVEVMSDYSAVYARGQRAAFYQWMGLARKKGNPIAKAVQQLALAAKIRTMSHHPLWMIDLGLTDPMTKLRMDQSADLVAKEWGITREEQDLFSWESQRRASAAQKSGRLAKEIIAFRGLDQDNGIRHDQTLEQLARLRPRYKDGTVTPGNASQITDGACSILVADEEFAKAMGWPVVASLSTARWAVAGCDPARFGFAPALSIKKVLDLAGMKLADLSLIETNEAFAAVVLAQKKALTSKKHCEELGMGAPLGEWADELVNVNGGAVALGHPISASGARLTLTCARELELREKRFGLVTLCIGGGQGEAIILERGE